MLVLLATSLTSSDPLWSLVRWVKPVIILASLLLILSVPLNETWVQRLKTALIAGLIAGVCALILEHYADFVLRGLVDEDSARRASTTNLKRPAAVICAWLFPALIVLMFNGQTPKVPPVLGWGLIGLIFFALGAEFLALSAATVIVALVSAFFAMVIVAIFGRKSLTVFAVLCGLAMLLTPFVVNFAVPDSDTFFPRDFLSTLIQRLVLWREASHYLLQDPLWGCGVDCARLQTASQYETVLIKYMDSTGNIFEQVMSRWNIHPHNFAVQIWLEGGLLAASMMSFVIFQSFQLIKRSFSPLQKGVSPAIFSVGWIAAILSISSASWSFWDTTWLAPIGFSAYLLWQVLRSSKTSPPQD